MPGKGEKKEINLVRRNKFLSPSQGDGAVGVDRDLFFLDGCCRGVVGDNLEHACSKTGRMATRPLRATRRSRFPCGLGSLVIEHHAYGEKGNYC